MTIDQFITKYLGKKVDWDGAYGGQCVDLFRQYLNDVLNFPQPRGVVGAADFWTNYDSDPNLKNNFQKIANSPTGVPAKGDVMVWNKKAGGGFGHIAIFLEGNVNLFTSLDQNWPTLSKVTKTVHNYTNVLGWLRPNKPENKPIGGQMNIDPKLFEELVGKSTKYDEFVNAGYSDPKAVSEEIEKLKKSRKNLEKSLETTEKALADKALYVTDLEAERETLKKQIRDLKEELSTPHSSVDPTHFSDSIAILESKIDRVLDSFSSVATKSQQKEIIDQVKEIKQDLKKQPQDEDEPNDPPNSPATGILEQIINIMKGRYGFN